MLNTIQYLNLNLLLHHKKQVKDKMMLCKGWKPVAVFQWRGKIRGNAHRTWYEESPLKGSIL